jgi:hypothetical protein
MAHDVWDGKCKKILGITVFLADPETFVTYAIPVAVTPPSNGETALALSTDCLASLERYRMIYKDFMRASNDNCTTAKKTGRL